MLRTPHPNDTPLFRGRRNELLEILRSKGIKDAHVLAAMGKVPRQFFFPDEFSQFAYRDEAFPIGHGQTISQPYTVAYQSSLLQARPGMSVLEIGTGSGYQAAVLEAMELDVYSVEIIEPLLESARKTLKLLDSQTKLFHSDGSLGLNNHAPYDRILVTAGAPAIPKALLAQLKPQGIMVIPVGKTPNDQKMVRVKLGPQGAESELFDAFRFVPLTGKLGWNQP